MGEAHPCMETKWSGACLTGLEPGAHDRRLDRGSHRVDTEREESRTLRDPRALSHVNDYFCIMDLSTLGKWVIVLGLGVIAVGAMIWLAGKIGLPFGNLPGDIRVERPGFSFHFPLATGIILSIVLTLLLNILLRFFRR
jgi:Protein of unknown function (DUF2905)